jgi:hypothetical protein
VTNGSNESLARAHELLERLQTKLSELERMAESGETDGAVDDLTQIAELAKEIEVVRARQAADAGA